MMDITVLSVQEIVKQIEAGKKADEEFFLKYGFHLQFVDYIDILHPSERIDQNGRHPRQSTHSHP